MKLINYDKLQFDNISDIKEYINENILYVKDLILSDINTYIINEKLNGDGDIDNDDAINVNISNETQNKINDLNYFERIILIQIIKDKINLSDWKTIEDFVDQYGKFLSSFRIELDRFKIRDKKIETLLND